MAGRVVMSLNQVILPRVPARNPLNWSVQVQFLLLKDELWLSM